MLGNRRDLFLGEGSVLGFPCVENCVERFLAILIGCEALQRFASRRRPRRKYSPGSPRPTSRSPLGQPLGNQAVGFTIRQCVALAGPRVNEWAGGSECAADGCEIVGVPRQYIFLEAHGQHDEMCVHDIGRSRSSQQSANCWTVVECVNRHMLEEGS